MQKKKELLDIYTYMNVEYRNITKEDIISISKICNQDLTNRNDLFLDWSIVTIDTNTNEIISFVLLGNRTLTEYFCGRLPNTNEFNDKEGSKEIIAYHVGNKEVFSKCNHISLREPSKRNEMEIWYIPKNFKDKEKACEHLWLSDTEYSVDTLI